MACQASAHVARVWNSCADWLHKGRTLMGGRKRSLLAFWKCLCFILSAITAVGHLGAVVGQWGTENTFFSAPSIPRGGERHTRGHLRGCPVVARLGPLLLLPGWSGRFLRHWIQDNLGPRSLALREVVASWRAWAPSISLLLRRSGLRGGWRWLGCLLSRCRFGATGSRRRAGLFVEEVSHRLRWLLSLRESLSEALHSWSKQATWRDRSVEEGNFIRLFHLS